MIPIATARELAGAVRLAYCLPSVFYLKCDFRLPKTLHQETETARAHTVRLAARPPQKHREPQTCTRPERSAGQNDRGTQSRRRRKQELKGPASRNPKRPSSTGAPSSTQREPARQAGLGGGGWWVQTCRAHVALCTVTVLVYGSFIITNLNLNGAVPGRLMLVVRVAGVVRFVRCPAAPRQLHHAPPPGAGWCSAGRSAAAAAPGHRSAR